MPNAPPPPEPGRASLVFSGAYEARISGEGVDCEDDGSFSVSSSELLGFASTPRWALVALSEQTHFSVGPIGAGERYSAKVRTLHRGSDKTSVNLELSSEKSGKVVRVTGEVSCPPKASANQIPEPVVELLRTHAKSSVRRFSTQDFGRARDVRSISAVVAESAGETTLSSMRRALPPGYVAFIGTTQWLGDEKHDGVEIVVGPGRDQFDMLRLARSDAVNYDMTTEALVKELRKYHRVDPIDIFHAETDTIQFRFLGAPKDPKALAKQIYEFCPDTVDQGVGTLEALETAIRRERMVTLWWD
jgi:hypothetical protein